MKEPINICLTIFRDLPDPRMERTRQHSLEVIMFVALCTYLTGGEGFYDMEAFAEARADWLRETIGMKDPPSHDTFNRVFQALAPESFGQCLIELSQRLRKTISGEVVAFDGKTHRRTGSDTQNALHMLNAWAVENHLVLGQLAVEKKSNEIKAMPELMDALDLKGCVVTADAMHCQKAVAAKAGERKADYILPVKSNQPRLLEEVSRFMDQLFQMEPAGYEQTEKEHGRLETRRCWQSTDIEWFADKKEWAGLRSFGLLESTREWKGRSETVRHYYISSLPDNPQSWRRVFEVIGT